jgi:thiamine pyrophosphate-dependent acetolactate synthase large subunit-like protein
MPHDDPPWMGGMGFMDSKPVYNAVMSADLLLMAGTDYPDSNFLPNRLVVAQIDERPEVLGRRAPTAPGAAQTGCAPALFLPHMAARFRLWLTFARRRAWPLQLPGWRAWSPRSPPTSRTAT